MNARVEEREKKQQNISRAKLAYYPAAEAPIAPLASSSKTSPPFAHPADLNANKNGHVFPSSYNKIAFPSMEIPASRRIYVAPRPELPYPIAPHDTHEYSAHAITRLDKLMHSLPESKEKAWGTAISCYHAWCSQEGIKDELRFPISTFRMTIYLSSLAGRLSKDTLKKRISSLREYSKWLMIPFEVDEKLLKPWLDAAKQLQAPPKPKRPPFLAQDAERLIELVKKISNDYADLFHLCMLAASLVGWGCLMRSGEFTLKTASPTEGDLARLVKRRHVRFVADTDTFTLHLPHDKTHGAQGRDVALSTFGLPINNILRQHLVENNIQDDEALFTYTATRGRHKGERVTITRDSWLRWLDSQLQDLGLPKLSGHSLRIGGATQLLLNGVSPLAVKAAGGWSDIDSFLGYWRQIPDIVALNKKGQRATAPPDALHVTDNDLRTVCRVFWHRQRHETHTRCAHRHTPETSVTSKDY